MFETCKNELMFSNVDIIQCDKFYIDVSNIFERAMQKLQHFSSYATIK